jgi:hypothetical protein
LNRTYFISFSDSDPEYARGVSDTELAEIIDRETHAKELLFELEQAQQALDACRLSYECRGDYYDGYATQALRGVNALLARVKGDSAMTPNLSTEQTRDYAAGAVAERARLGKLVDERIEEYWAGGDYSSIADLSRDLRVIFAPAAQPNKEGAQP